MNTSRHALLLCLLLAAASARAQQSDPTLPAAVRPDASAAGAVSSTPPSNSVAHMFAHPHGLLIGTGKGLARTSDGGLTWESFRGLPEFPVPGVFSLAARGNLLWTSLGFTKDVDGQSIQTGAGYTVSTDNGVTWTHRGQTLDARDDSIVTYGGNRVTFLPVIVPEQNVTFDVALGDSTVWIASWASGLRRSSDLGATWQRVVLPNDGRNSISPADSLGRYHVDPRRDNNFLGFAVYVQDDTTIWYGSAGGVNRSTDGGTSWVRFSTLNQISSILGNWVIAIAGQPIPGGTRIWTTNWKADLDPDEEFGVSTTDDGGRIWRNHLPGVRAYAFAFRDSITYIATDDGLYRTDDGGDTWTRSGTIIDQTTRDRITTRTFFSVAVLGDTVIAGGGSGMAATVDNASSPFGSAWRVLRTAVPVPPGGSTYAYPNPFSPDDESIRIHYATGAEPARVTIEIFDFAMSRVRTLLRDAERPAQAQFDEIWNGRDDDDGRIANGVYFYRVIRNGGEPAWGKVLVLQ